MSGSDRVAAPEPGLSGLSPEEAADDLGRLLSRRSFRTGNFVLSSGRESSYYVDCRTTTMHARGQALLGRVVLDRLSRLDVRPDFIGGMTMGADPIAYAVAGQSARSGGREIHAFSVRKRAKRHGREKRIEGCFEEGGSAVVVEDVVTTGSSVLEACEVVADAGGEILAVLVLVDRQEGGREAVEEKGLSVHALYTATDLESFGR